MMGSHHTYRDALPGMFTLALFGHSHARAAVLDGGSAVLEESSRHGMTSRVTRRVLVALDTGDRHLAADLDVLASRSICASQSWGQLL
jgi:hypothetical protein